MRLQIENFAKIKHADICIDGLTVIAGENNMGKSTIGKVLYSACNALCDIEVKIEKYREKEIRKICKDILRKMMHAGGFDKQSAASRAIVHLLADIEKSLAADIMDMTAEDVNKENYGCLLIQFCAEHNLQMDEKEIWEHAEESFEKIAAVLKYDSNKIGMEYIQRFFLDIFDTQLNCLKHTAGISDIRLNSGDKEILLQFQNHACISWKAEYPVTQEVFFVDDPFILDNLSGYLYEFVSSTKKIRGELIKRLSSAENDRMKGIMEAVNAKEKLKEIYRVLDAEAKGEIILRNNEWMVDTGAFEQPLHADNLSAGLKSFILLRMLLEKGILKEQDVLILDEPEIHLHPKWQLIYAEFIVLLQKTFHIKAVVTTHSRDFLEAVELYAEKYGQKCHFYLSGMEDGLAVFEDVTMDLSSVYRQLVTPSMLLDHLRYEMEEKEDESF